VSIGALVNKFIVQTYTRVREEQSGLEKVAITPEDLTKLGRKIFSTFAKRRNKIQHIPFISFAETPFKVLHFSATGGKMGEPEAWEIQGAQKISTSERLHLTDLARNESLPKLLAWLIANEIYTPGMLIRGDYSISPVTTRDLEVLLQKLRSFFPTSRTFDTDIGETLNPERVVKAFFIINLIKPREIHSPQEASIVYSTNWGELFCVTAPVRNNDLHEDPMAFLVANVPQSVPEKLSIQSFVPTRSKCPSLDFPSHAPSG
jgi:adenylate cyclase class 1